MGKSNSYQAIWKRKDRKKHPEKYKKRMQKYYKNNRKKLINRVKKYTEDNKEKVKIRKNKHYMAIREARRWDNIRKLYGLSKEDYDKLYVNQQGRCAVCRIELPVLHIDHFHEDGTIRGLLCGKCNRGIGLFDDNIELLEAVIKYLRKR